MTENIRTWASRNSLKQRLMPEQNHLEVANVEVSHIFKVTNHQLTELFDQELTYEDRKSKLEALGGSQGLLHKLQSEASTGIMGDERDMTRRQTYFGHNLKPQPQLPPFSESLKEALNDRILLILAVFAVLSIITGMIYNPRNGWVEGVSIFIAVFVLVLITSLNDWSKDKQFVKLQSISRDENLPVVRGKHGQMTTVNCWDFVVGDVINLNAGDRVPADCIIIKSARVEVNEETAVTKAEGSRPKDESNPFLFADSFLVEGSCTALVTCVGLHSTRDKMEAKIDTESKTDLQKKLYNLSKTFTYIGIWSAIIILITAIVIQCIQTGVNEEIGGTIFMKKLMENFTLAVVIIMVSIPEGLPMVVAISLAYSTIRMFEKDKILVRNLGSPEKMGQITELVTGCTGTLTTCNMTVKKFHMQDVLVLNDRVDTINNCVVGPQISNILIENILYNNQCHIEIDEMSFYVPVGNETEVGLIKWLQAASINVHSRMQDRIDQEVARIPFNSEKKRSVVAHRPADMADTVRVYVKGAPEYILPNCNTHYNAAGQKVPFLEQTRETLTNSIISEKMTRQGLRTIAFSYRDFTVEAFEEIKELTKDFTAPDSSEMLESDNTLLALVAMQDPLRDRVKNVVLFAEKGKVNVRMVTNNSLDTAKAVAVEAGILPKEIFSWPMDKQVQYAMHAADFKQAVGGIRQTQDEDGNMKFVPQDQQAFDQVMINLQVLARAGPREKLLLTAGLKASGKQVAVIGDSLADVDSFRTADVSFSMMSGSAFSRNESDMVLVTNDFESCLRAVMWGRNIYTNIKRFLQFQITCNFSVLITVFIGYLYLTESPLNSVQLLWINLIMDTLAALALATSPPLTTVIHEPPITGSTKILQRVIWRQIYGVTLWNVLVMMIIIFAGKGMFNLEYSNDVQTTDTVDGHLTPEAIAKKQHLTIIFNTFVFLQFFNELNCRVVGVRELNVFKKFFQNWIYILVVCCTYIVQWSACNWLFFVFDTYELTNQQFFRCVAWGSSALLCAFVLKLTPEQLVEKLPIGIDEQKSLGENNAMMRAYEKTANAKAYNNSKKAEEANISQAYSQEGALQSGEDSARVADNKDDDFKPA